MRTNASITAAWESGGPFVDTAQPHSRVTVQLPWSDLSGEHKYDILRTTYVMGIGNYKARGIPLRWFQDAANDQLEAEVPNIASVNTSRSIDSDAATFDISLYNQQMYNNGVGPTATDETGQPGYFSFNRGVASDARGRWAQVRNAWENLLVPDAIIRTYQGYGGNSLSIPAAIAAGNIMLTGTWIVDTVAISSNGMMQLKGRDAAKLLLDQQLYLPLVPKDKYPLTYYRWVIDNVAVKAAAHQVTTTTQSSQASVGEKITNYETSSVDAWYDSVYGHDMLLHGHHPSDAFDGDESTFFLGEGNSGPSKPFAVNYLQATCGEQMNAVYVSPWAGNYTMYVSVMENGVWQGDPNTLIPYDPSLLFGSQPYAVDTGAAIPYVAAFGVPWETPQDYVLPRVYQADRVRVSFRDLTYTDWGPWQYRSGVREFKIRVSDGAVTQTSTSTTNTIQPVFYAATSILDPANPNTTGYLTGADIGGVDAFGDARLFSNTGGDAETGDRVAGLAFTKTRQGYYVLRIDGTLTCYGDAVFYGSPKSRKAVNIMSNGSPNLFVDVLVTHTGLGYWVTTWDGTILSFGDAPSYASVSVGSEIIARSCAHPTSYGLFMVSSTGVVTVRGAATSYGNFTGVALSFNSYELASDIQCTSTGLGYWLLTTAGRVQAKGAAVDYGSILNPTPTTDNYSRYYAILPAPDNMGYLVMKGDGNILPAAGFGTVSQFGSPLPGTQAQLRRDGNYLDYTDIIKDLALWAGFLLYDPATASNAQPSVHGNLESTGAFSPEDLPTDIFDKRPVIDAMHAIKEIVGYLLWVDEEGGLHFESPNWWAPGNFDEDGVHTTTLPVFDEKVTLIDYSATIADEPLRSMIIVSSLDPSPTRTVDNQVQQAPAGTITTRLRPSTAKRLRGLIKPAMWVNGYFLRPEEQKLMAELIALHINFQSRVGQVTCTANPCLQINDQVRIFERQSADTYVHYVRGIDSSHDLDKGRYTMTVTTHWLGSEEQWAIQAQGAFVTSDYDDPNVPYSISTALAEMLRKQFGSKAANEFGHTLVPTNTSVATGTQTGTGSGPH